MINFQENVYDLAYKGAVDDVKQKVNVCPDIVNSRDGNERLLIHWSALSGCYQLVQFLLDHGSPVDPLDDIGMTPLILAASGNRSDVVKLLIERGADVNAQNNEGHSALQYSASKGWKQIVDLLIQNGANVNIADKRRATPLHRAASRGDISVISLMLKHAGRDLAINAVDTYGNTPLHLACEENNLPMAELLIQNGANIELKNKEEKTAFELASLQVRRSLQNIPGYQH